MSTTTRLSFGRTADRLLAACAELPCTVRRLSCSRAVLSVRRSPLIRSPLSSICYLSGSDERIQYRGIVPENRDHGWLAGIVNRIVRRGLSVSRGARSSEEGETTGSAEETAITVQQTLTPADRENLARAVALSRVDLSQHNRSCQTPVFSSLVSQVASAAQFADPDYVQWAELLGFAENGKLVVRGTTPTIFNRKVWEWAYILQAAKQCGRLTPGMTAVGFGVGNEPIPAVLARCGLRIVATDQDVAESEDWEATGQWATSGQLLTGLEGLSRPSIVPNDQLASHVTLRRVDMNSVPADLGPYDLTWSSCALEHLGSPKQGLDFVIRSAQLLAPGGVAAHTTELELTGRETTADWGHLACYRPADLQWLAEEITAQGLEMHLNLYVPMDIPEDRWISLALTHGPELEAGELSHIKVAMFESVCTSVGVLIHRPVSS